VVAKRGYQVINEMIMSVYRKPLQEYILRETQVQLKDNMKTGDEVAERINLAQNRISWQSLVECAITIRVA